MKGIDISQYQKGIDFDSVKKQYDFVILRGGYTGYGSTRPLCKDECFEDFYKACKDRGIPVGVYWYSCANSKKFGQMEATFLYDNCLKGKKFQYPIWIDVEDIHWQKGNKAGVTEACKGFCEELEGLGYYVGIYGSDYSTFKDMVYLEELTAYDKWVAKWGNIKPSYVLDYGMWQTSNCGHVDNFFGAVDTDESFRDYPNIILANNLNGYRRPNGSDEDGSTSNDNNSSSDTNNSNNSQSFIEYIVKGGDTLSGIAQVYGLTWQQLAEYNHLENPNLIYPNQVIKIPTFGNTPTNDNYIDYVVKSGDTLSKIATMYGTTWQKIAEFNHLANPNLIYPNQIIKIPK